MTIYSDPEWDKNLIYVEMLRDFVKMIKGKKHTCITLEEAKNTVSLIGEIKLHADME